MANYKVYVRGHGGATSAPFTPSKDVAIDVIKLGEFGCTMLDEVADKYVSDHFGYAEIKKQVDDEVVIYWTRLERDEWDDKGVLHYSKPALTITPYATRIVGRWPPGDMIFACIFESKWHRIRLFFKFTVFR